MEPILQEWQNFAVSLGAITSAMDAAALRDHAEEMLRAIAADIETPQTSAQQFAKSTGNAPPRESGLPDSAATLHGRARAAEGFTLIQMIAEYRALRASVLKLWAKYELASGGGVLTDDAYEQQIRFNEAIDEAVTDSIVVFAHAVDQMTAAKARRRMEALGTLAAGLGHDMTNILVPMRWCVETLQRELDGKAGKSRETLESLEGSIAQLDGLTRGIKALSKDPDDVARSREFTVLKEWWKTAVGPVTWAVPRGVQIHVEGFTDADPALPAVRIPDHVLMQAVYNLVQNAAQAIAQHIAGTVAAGNPKPHCNIWIKAERAPASGTNVMHAHHAHSAGVDGGVSVNGRAGQNAVEGGAVRITVRDDGPGMDEVTVQRCTDAFYTTKASQLGNGLGLFVVRGAVERHGATLAVESRLGHGALFTLMLPVVNAETAAVTVPKPSGTQTAGSATSET